MSKDKFVFSKKLNALLIYGDYPEFDCYDCRLFMDLDIECNRDYEHCKKIHDDILGIDLYGCHLENFSPIRIKGMNLILSKFLPRNIMKIYDLVHPALKPPGDEN